MPTLEERFRGLSTSSLCFTRSRVLEDIRYYESGARPLRPYLVLEEDVPIILRGLRHQAAELAAELQRRGLVDELREDPPA